MPVLLLVMKKNVTAIQIDEPEVQEVSEYIVNKALEDTGVLVSPNGTTKYS